MSPPSPSNALSPEPRRPSRLRTWSREILSVGVFVLALIAARSSLADHYFVPTGSMVPTVAVGDRVLVNKLAYGLRVPFTDVVVTDLGMPERGDVVVLRSPENGITLLKRVVAVPGDEVAVLNGKLWINGQPVPVVWDDGDLMERLGDAPHPVRLTRGGGMDFGPMVVGPDRYLVMGDNRGESHDGRAFGLVERSAIMGKAVGVWMRDGKFTWRAL